MQTDGELAELGKQTHYAAGFTDAAIESREDLFDVIANGACLVV